jgi:hypothetical protein
MSEEASTPIPSELTAILDQLEGGEAHHEAAARALAFLFANWAQARQEVAEGNLDDEAASHENLIDQFDQAIDVLASLRETVVSALEATSPATAPTI